MQFVNLPTTMEEVWRQIYLSCQNGRTGGQLEQRRTNEIRSYTEGALLSGRPLASTVILLCGNTGAGKSALINILFGDSDLCPTNQFTSETKNPVLLQKSLHITSLSPPIAGKLSFVDLPGTLDTDIERDLKHTQVIRNFLNKLNELKSRPYINRAISGASCMVYPNIVLLVLKASDNRILGNNTSLRKSLDQIKQTGKMVDLKRPNLIIVLTHACVLGLNQELFQKDLQEKRDQISKVVFEVLGITDLNIVPVENEPERYNLTKSGDFYALPNKELSHHNLIKTMMKLFDTNNDLIGRLNVGWYLNPNCPEKGLPVDVIHDTDANICQTGSLPDLKLASLSNTKFQTQNQYSVKLLGLGYSPSYEEFKSFCALQYSAQKNNFKVEQVGSKVYRFFPEITIQASGQDFTDGITNLTKKDYEKEIKNSFGLEHCLDVNVCSNKGLKWLEIDKAANTVKYEYWSNISLASLSINTRSLSLLNEILQYDLEALPTEYSGSSAISFTEFFKNWGSHFVHDVQIGGQIIVHLTAKNSTIFQNNSAELLKATRNTLRRFILGETSKSNLLFELQRIGVIKATFMLQGGRNLAKLDLQTVEYDHLKNWMTFIRNEPYELPSRIKLFPYYKIAPSAVVNALYLATSDYISRKGELPDFMEPLYRSVIAELAVSQARVLATQAKPITIDIDA